MIRRWAIAMVASLGLMATMAVATPPPPSSQALDQALGQALGTWINPHGSVKVQIAPCGSNLCGQVTWASPTAQADARASGVTHLIGLQLLRNYRNTGPGRYEGTVFVPDMGRSFQSFIKQRDADNLRISGCVLHGLICKSQDWRRV